MFDFPFKKKTQTLRLLQTVFSLNHDLFTQSMLFSHAMFQYFSIFWELITLDKITENLILERLVTFLDDFCYKQP